MSARRRRHGLNWPKAHFGFLVLLVTIIAGCSDDPPECNRPALTRDQESALIRTTLATTEGMVASAQDTTAAEIVAIASDFQAEHDHLSDPDPCEDRADVLMVYQLVIADLIANSPTISPELAAGLTDATRESGAGGLHTFLTESDVFFSNEYPGLAEMRDRLRAQKDRADEVFDALDLEESSSTASP